MNRTITVAAAAALLALVSACGSNYGNQTPTGPSDPAAPPSTSAVTIDILGERGALSFSPNPAAVPAGQMVVWHNTDSETHRVLLNDGRLDTGNIAPGGFSAPMMLVASGGYHCTIHPSMTGMLNGGTDGAAVSQPADPKDGTPAY